MGWAILGEILKFAGQNSYSERGACNWFYAYRIIGRGLMLSGGIGNRQGYLAVQYQYLTMCRAVTACRQNGI